MARKPRFNLLGIPQHVIQRGNIREPCFYTGQDYHRNPDFSTYFGSTSPLQTAEMREGFRICSMDAAKGAAGAWMYHQVSSVRILNDARETAG